MFDPKQIFPIVRKSMTRGSDQQVMQALQKLAQAHPELSSEQALAALQQAMPKQSPVQKYLGGEIK